MLVGYTAWVEVATEVEDVVFAIVGAFGLSCRSSSHLVNLAKEKFGLAVVGLFISAGRSWWAHFRLGQAALLWARVFYREGQSARARARFGGIP